MKKIEDKKKQLQKRLDGLKQYLLLKYEDEDWHGIMDAAADIREISVQIDLLEEIENNQD